MRKKILLIDDNPITNNILINKLRSHFDVDVVMYVNVATRLLNRINYDIIIIDVMMPTQNLNTRREMETGYFYYDNVVRRIRSHTPVIFWSRLSEDSFNTYFHNRINANLSFVQKNSETNDLLDAINMRLGID